MSRNGFEDELTMQIGLILKITEYDYCLVKYILKINLTHF